MFQKASKIRLYTSLPQASGIWEIKRRCVSQLSDQTNPCCGWKYQRRGRSRSDRISSGVVARLLMSTCDLSAFPTHTYWQDHFPVGALSNLEPLGLRFVVSKDRRGLSALSAACAVLYRCCRRCELHPPLHFTPDSTFFSLFSCRKPPELTCCL